MFFTLLVLVGTLLHGYVWWRLGSLPWLRDQLSPVQLWTVGGALWLLYLAGALFGHNSREGIGHWLDSFTLNWLAVLFLTASCLLAVDLLSGFGWWWTRHLTVLRSGALAVAALLVAVALVQGLRAPVVTRYEVSLRGLPRALDGTRVVALSDLHLGAQLGPRWLAARVTQVQALQPDLIVLVGDLFEGHGPPDPALAQVLRGLSAPLGVYAVTGNHEFYGDAGALALTKDAGIRWLNDRWVALRPGLTLAGIDDLSLAG